MRNVLLDIYLVTVLNICSCKDRHSVMSFYHWFEFRTDLLMLLLFLWTTVQLIIYSQSQDFQISIWLLVTSLMSKQNLEIKRDLPWLVEVWLWFYFDINRNKVLYGPPDRGFPTLNTLSCKVSWDWVSSRLIGYASPLLHITPCSCWCQSRITIKLRLTKVSLV